MWSGESLENELIYKSGEKVDLLVSSSIQQWLKTFGLFGRVRDVHWRREQTRVGTLCHSNPKCTSPAVFQQNGTHKDPLVQIGGCIMQRWSSGLSQREGGSPSQAFPLELHKRCITLLSNSNGLKQTTTQCNQGRPVQSRCFIPSEWSVEV